MKSPRRGGQVPKNTGGKVDIHAVARAAKTSISTVSRSFNHPDLVNPATRRRIDRAVKKLGYIRNRAAQAMHGRRSGTIGLVVPTIDHAIFGEVVQAFSDAVDAHGFTILMASHGFDLEREYLGLRKFLEHRVDGIALIGLDHAAETFQLLDEQRVPAISIWNHAADSPLSCVGANNRAAGAMAARHLLELGHREIGTVFPDAAQNDRARGRREGAYAVLEAAGITVPAAWSSEAPYNITQAKAACAEILRQAHRPTALLCGNDVLAQGALFAARHLGVAVPDALSVIGIGDFKGSAEIEPALTTIRIPAREIGTLAGQRLAEMITEGRADITRTLCDLRLMPRASTRAL